MTRSPLQTERTGTVLSALNAALHRMMSTDPRVIVLGEDVRDPYGGAFKVTRGLSTLYPERVLSTPISELAIAGLAAGLALRGLRPVAEIMFGDFLTLAADQLINHAAKFSWMYNHTAAAPMVVRTPMGGRRGYGPTHSQSLEKHFLGVPGLMVAAVSPVTDAGELLERAVFQNEGPVLFIENKQLYTQEMVAEVPGWEREVMNDDSAFFPTVVFRQQFSAHSDALLFCYGGMTPVCLDALSTLHEREGLNCDLAVFSQLSPVPQKHLAAILAHPGCPSLCLYAEEAPLEAGWGAEMIASVEAALDARSGGGASSMRHVRIGADPVPIGAARAIEHEALPQVEDIVETLVNCF